MPVEFRFASLSIRNFRGIRELDLGLPEGVPVHCIGGNNSGKSTVLDAMELVLRGGPIAGAAPRRRAAICKEEAPG